MDSSRRSERTKINTRVRNREIHVSPSDKGKGIATSLIPKGYRWTEENSGWTLSWSATMEEEDKMRSEELATVQKIKWIGDKLIPGLKLTCDIPEMHDSKDVLCWISKFGLKR